MEAALSIKQDFIITQDTSNHNDFFVTFCNLCKENLGEETFGKWLSGLTLFSLSGSELILLAPSKFIRDWVVREFIENKKPTHNLQKIATTIDEKIKKVRIILDQNSKQSNFTNQDDSIVSVAKKAEIVNLSKHGNVFSFGSELNPKYNFANFIEGKYNRFAIAMAKIAAGNNQNAQGNLFDDAIPLFIHGNVGMGKTHLAQAIAWQIKEQNSNKKVVYLTAEKFMNHFIDAVRSNSTADFKQQFRSIDVLIIDDMQFIAGKQATQEEFMHSFNNLVENKKQVVLVCDRSPNDLEAIDEKLKSRISGGMIVNFQNPDFNDRLQILKSKLSGSNEVIDEKILEFLASKINSSIRDLEGALRKLLAKKIFNNEEINLENARIIAADYIKSNKENSVSIDKIQKIVCEYFDIKITNLLANTRARNIAYPRQIAMYLAKNLTGESLPKIGRDFGNKNHATVIYATKTIEKEIAENVDFAKKIKALEEKILS